MSSPRPLYARCVWSGLALWAALSGTLCAQYGHSLQQAQPVAATEPTGPVRIAADWADQFTSGSEQVWLLRGACRVQQGNEVWTAPQMVLWQPVDPSGSASVCVLYAEGSGDTLANYSRNGSQESRGYFFARLQGPLISSVTPQPAADSREDPVYLRALQRRQSARTPLQQTQFIVPPAPGGSVPLQPARPVIRRQVSINPRVFGERFEFKVEPVTGVVPAEYIATITGGVNIVVDNVPLQVGSTVFLTRVDLSADRAVIWSDADRFSEFGGFELDENTPFQVYLEGNIVARQGLSDIRASHAFFDLSNRRGLALNAEVRSYLPQLDGALRVRAAELRQLSESSYHAKNAWFTTSQFGHPKWRVEASDVFVQERQNANFSSWNPFAADEDPNTVWVSSLNNRFFIEDTPVFMTPSFSSPAEDPHAPIHGVSGGYSSMFGLEARTIWNVDGLFGFSLPKNTDWFLNVDYLTARGPGVGTEFNYELTDTFFGLPARYQGENAINYQYDTGRDRLGADRMSLGVPNEHRGRILTRNRVDLPFDTWLIAESGHVFNQDRNFIEQFYEEDWDTGKDYENVLSLQQRMANHEWSVMTRWRSNNFLNSTDWLPRVDLYSLGEPVLGGPFTWSQHSSAGYGRLRPAVGPNDPVADPWAPLPYFADAQGLVAMTRHELSLPFDLGPVHVVPYALGEAAFWQEDLFGNDLARLYGSAGVRGSVQFSKYMPHIYDPILGLNGLAHKVVFDFDYSYSDATRRLFEIPQYNEFDDNAQERFRERFLAYQFGGALPGIYDPRTYAVRSGAGRDVSSPYHELVDRQQVLWLGMHHRWQTKVGPPDRPKIVDWMELDTGIALFPDADRDNFGEHFGLFNFRYAWHLGPRTSLLANGVFDFFDDGQRVWNVGMLSQRSRRGSIYLGYREVQAGEINSQLVTGSFSYAMSPLYIATLGGSFDVAEGLDRGQSLTFSRVGESWLLHFGIGYDRSKDNIGVALMFEPKFGNLGGSSMQLNNLLGIQ